jgi:hypothetical protein
MDRCPAQSLFQLLLVTENPHCGRCPGGGRQLEVP